MLPGTSMYVHTSLTLGLIINYWRTKMAAMDEMVLTLTRTTDRMPYHNISLILQPNLYIFLCKHPNIDLWPFHLTADDISMTGDNSLLTPQEIKTMGDDSMPIANRKSWEDEWMSGEPVYS